MQLIQISARGDNSPRISSSQVPDQGPLFMFQSGKPLTCPALIHHLREALVREGIPAGNYSGHSFRIRAATTAAHCGIEDSLIQTLGRWKSAAYLSYIRIPREQLAAIAARLVANSTKFSFLCHLDCVHGIVL